ncbi:hypothetical protein [Halorubrum ezzemoulense]|nr:hypothetical protein [Halorubrum ezzemoulense]MDB2239033.1 hypothetical protein [Halorubrum ezzemoulense]MDB2249870.1 hypothetical protein [Halorubrum ezzemoulense]MDB2272008.1 hypothetical protein [Halorubrum ezzemoulense]MDB9300400.1 hypothetical protein [Halorubrum ezzemoulense]
MTRDLGTAARGVSGRATRPPGAIDAMSGETTTADRRSRRTGR